MSQTLEDYEYTCIDCGNPVSRPECETCGAGQNYLVLYGENVCPSCLRHEWVRCDCCVDDCEGCHNCEDD